MKLSEFKQLIRKEIQTILNESISDFVTEKDWLEYLSKLNYKVRAHKQTKTGFEANLLSTPDKKYFTQIGKNNWVRLSYKDINNPKITHGKFVYNKIYR